MVVVQLFTRYSDLTSCGVSVERENAAFVGERAAEAHGQLAYHGLTLAASPPKRGEPLRDEWRAAVEGVAGAIAELA